MVELSAWTRGDRGIVLGVLVLLAFLASVAAPLWTYGVTFVLFGPAHILSELRYVERRFGASLVGLYGVGVMVGVVGTGATRLLRVADVVPGDTARVVELLGVAALAAIAATVGRAGVAVLCGAAIAVGVMWDPATTLLILAILHNWTPVGFFLEVTEGSERRLALRASAVVFGVLPLLIAIGAPQAVLASVGLDAPDVAAFAPGPLTRQLGAYLPDSLRGAAGARAFFSAVVFAQVLHYISVIAVMPTLGGRGFSWLLAKLPAAWFVGLVVGVTLVFVAGSVRDFGASRAWYGVIGAVHAWLEVPVLLAALTPSRRG